MKFNKILLSTFALGLFSLAALVGCEDDSATENKTNGAYIGVMDLPLLYEIDLGESLTIEGKVYVSQASSSDRIVDLRVDVEHDTDPTNNQDITSTDLDASDYTVPASVTIPAGATEASFPITITNTKTDYDTRQVVFSIVPKVGQDIAMSLNTNEGRVMSKRTPVRFKRACTENSLNITIVTDDFGSETSWELYDSNGNFIANSVPYIDGGAGETRALCLPDGDYLFYILDSYGDGFGTGGSYTLSKRAADGSQVQIATGSGNFGNFDEVAFSLP